VLLAGEMSDDRENFDVDALAAEPVESAEPAPPPVLEPPTPPPSVGEPAPPIAALDPQTLAIVQALSGVQNANLAAILQQLVDSQQQAMLGIVESAKPVRRSRDDWEFENKSVYNPQGELHHPRPQLKADFFWAVIDENDPTKAPAPLYPIERETCTFEECTLLNQIEPGHYTIIRNDDEPTPMVVYPKRDLATGQIRQMFLAFKKTLYERQTRNNLPPLRKVVQQALAATGA
jgi:hypothetical protein